MKKQFEALINTPFGAVLIAKHDKQLVIDFLLESPSQENCPSKNPVIQQVYVQIMQYLQQPNTPFNLPLTMQGTIFQRRVWQAIVAIPLGQTRTYGQIARQLGSGARAVANACGANSTPLLIPCHRVVAQNGIGGFMQGKPKGLLIKQWLLAHEGVPEYKQSYEYE